MQIETIKIYYFTPIRHKMRGGGEDGSNRWLIAGGSVLSTTTLETSLSFSYKIEYLHTL